MQQQVASMPLEIWQDDPLVRIGDLSTYTKASNVSQVLYDFFAVPYVLSWESAYLCYIDMARMAFQCPVLVSCT